MSSRGVEPVFALAGELPNEVTIAHICSAAESTAGYGTVIGAQRIGALYRIYPADTKARITILSLGFSVKGTKISLKGQNPFIIRGNNGEEIKTTRLTVDGVPISYSDTDIAVKFKKMGINSLGPLILDRARDGEGKLTRWLTGKRWVWIELPRTTLPRTVDMGPFRASLFYREMKGTADTRVCFKCHKEGHVAKACPLQLTCWTCK
ncbi:hypothetical protein ElyMa_000616300 [Elysia marginata]|uniref:CCHC-type domain-containing protein n=1 Tax=Elysia marginata TaxID=1093978 RepID=A0AAV4GAD4_9GAST|nr:hypothetical protein ElyMa_000616300 [Elysia marginata]